MLELNKKVLKPVRVGDTIYAEVEVTSVRPTSKGNRGIVASKDRHQESEWRVGHHLRGARACWRVKSK
jgi:acyl dehydratase